MHEADGQTPATVSGDDGTREPQYNRCVEIKQQFGLTQLGLMTNQVWHDDPRRLVFVLARYKFVSKMLSGKSHVLTTFTVAETPVVVIARFTVSSWPTFRVTLSIFADNPVISAIIR